MPGTTFTPSSWSGFDERPWQNPSASLTDFTGLINVANLSPLWKSKVQSDGGDIRIAKGDDTELPFDLIDWSYNAGNPTGWIRFKWTLTLASSGVQNVRVYAGYPAGTAVAYDPSETFGSDNAYDASWESYWPMDGDANDRIGSFDLTAVNGAAVGATGQVGEGTDLEAGTNQYWSQATPTLTAVPITLMAWAKPESLSAAQFLISVAKSTGTGDWFSLGLTNTGAAEAQTNGSGGFGAATTTTTVGVGSWRHCAAVFAANNSRVAYINGGSPVSNTTTSTPSGINRMGVGALVDSLGPRLPLDGVGDEFQIHSVARSQDWIAHEVSQSNDNATFWGTWTWTSLGGVATKYKEIKYKANGVPAENLTDFPKLVKITADADIAAELASGGNIRFTSADGLTNLPFGLYPSSNLAAGTVKARVKFDLSSAASVGDVIGRIYYGSAEEDFENKHATVEGYKLFAPLEEDPSGSAPQIFDWVTETYVGTSVGAMTAGDLVAAQVENGLDFDGTNDYISLGTLAGVSHSLNRSFTIEAWARRASAVAGCIFSTGRSEVSLRVTAAGKLEFLECNTAVVLTGTGTRSAATWFHAAATVGSGSPANVKLYLDGAADGNTTTTRTFTDGPDVSTIGSEVISGTAFAFWSGIIDEVRISNSERSANWIAYARYDDFNNADTFDLSTEQGGGGGGGDLTLTAGSASFALSGSPASLNKGYRLSAGGGSFTLTGSPVSLQRNRTLQASGKTLTLTGGNATFQSGKRLLAEPIAFLVSISDTSLLKDNLLIGETVEYDVSFGDVTLTDGLTLEAEPVSYSLTVGDSILTKTHVVSLDSALFNLTVGDAALTSGETMSAEGVTYTLDVGDIFVMKGIALDAEAVSYTLSVSPMSFVRHYILNAEPVTYSLTGMDITLYKAGEAIVGGKFAMAQVYLPGFQQVEIVSPGFRAGDVSSY